MSNVKIIPKYSWVDNTIATEMPNHTSAPALTTEYTCYWYVHGCRFYDTRSFCDAANHDNETKLLWVLTYGDLLPISPKDVKHIETSYNEQ